MRDCYYEHEALHTCHVLTCTWDEHVANSKTVLDNPELKKLADEATTAMAKLYQAIGEVRFDCEDEKETK